MNKYYYDTPEEFLKEDNSYLRVNHKITNVFSKAFCFWHHIDTKNLEHSPSKGNQRESYEAGVKIGWELAMRKQETNGSNPNPVGLSRKELNEIMFILNALGIQFIYMLEPPSYVREHTPYSVNGFQPGLNICKNIDAINAGVTVNSDIKNKIIEIIKTYTPQYMWPNE